MFLKNKEAKRGWLTIKGIKYKGEQDPQIWMPESETFWRLLS
jgi:hypothetical protein